MARKLDLSQLTEEELQHVLHVVQRDMNLRKKEDERLGELKCKIEEERFKRKFLTRQVKFNEGHCILCLEPFQFLMNGKRRCLDCSLNTCKRCSKFNKKEYGWVCDSCRIVRIVKTGSLDWFYNHVKSRFKNFGSAKVMHSLNKRLQSGEKYPLPHLDSQSEEGEFDDGSDSYLQGGYDPQMMAEVIEEDEDTLDNSEVQHYSTQRRNKRLLSVHLFDFDMDSEYSSQSRRPSLQVPSPHYEGNDFQSFSEFSFPGNGVTGEGSRKGSLIDNPELSSVFRSILQEKSQNLTPDQVFSTEVRVEINSRRKSLDRSCKPEELMHCEQRIPHVQSVPPICISNEETEVQKYLPQQRRRAQSYTDMESSDNDEAPEHPMYHRHFVQHRNKGTSLENSGAGGIQISDLSKRMSSIEQMLSRLEKKITPSFLKSPDNKGRPHVSSPARSMASGLDLTDVDLEEEKLKKKLDELACNISDRGPSSEDEQKMKTEISQEMSSSGEDLQNKTLKVSELENRIAALSAAGMNVSTVEKPKSNQDGQAMMMQMPPRRKSRISNGNKESETFKNESHEQNIQHKGSLTQRNPSKKNRRLDHVFGKPVVSMQP
ncbi:melanophilin-like isoform X1 [Mobula hypostoma]|uniref:melanophilin-like isoform X1 n=1 Tax=Mobula hypostoma TaxID=723540 RepID=UPI002FC2F111